jgi:osmotically-inducible protein OsmY
MIQKSDHERKGFLNFAFHKDWDDPSIYDLIINRDKLSAESASRLIIEVAKSQEIKECSLTALDFMERMSLEKKIQAAFINNDISTNEFHIEVPEKGVVQVTGVTYYEETKNRALRAINDISGVSEVISEVAVIPMYGE